MPVPGSGLGGQLMAAEETVWGTPVAVNRTFPFDNESLKYTPKPVQGQALVAGSYIEQSNTRANVASWVAGDLNFDHSSRGMGFWWKDALGNVSTAQQGSTIAYKHTFTLGSQMNGKGRTIQVGRPTTDGTVRPRTYAGCRVTSWELALAAQDILKFKVTLIGQTRATATALGTPSYPTSNNQMHFKQGAITVGGTPYIGLRDFTLDGDNGLAQDRIYIGNNGLISEPIRHAFTKLTGKMTADYVDTSMSDAFVADNELAIVLTFVGGLIVAGTPNYYETLTITCGGIRLNGDEEVISGPDILNNPIGFDNLAPMAGGTPFQVDYTTLDTVP